MADGLHRQSGKPYLAVYFRARTGGKSPHVIGVMSLFGRPSIADLSAVAIVQVVVLFRDVEIQVAYLIRDSNILRWKLGK